MSWLLKKLGYRDREYRTKDFRGRIELVGREAVYVIHTRQGKSLIWTGSSSAKGGQGS